MNYAQFSSLGTYLRLRPDLDVLEGRSTAYRFNSCSQLEHILEYTRMQIEECREYLLEFTEEELTLMSILYDDRYRGAPRRCTKEERLEHENFILELPSIVRKALQ